MAHTFELARRHPSSLTPLPSPSLSFPLFFALPFPLENARRRRRPQVRMQLRPRGPKISFFFFLFFFFSFTDVEGFLLPSSARATFAMAIARWPSRGLDASAARGADVAATSPSRTQHDAPRMPHRKFHRQQHVPVAPQPCPLQPRAPQFSATSTGSSTLNATPRRGSRR